MDGCMTDGLTDGHMDDQRETIIPRHYRVAGIKIVQMPEPILMQKYFTMLTAELF